MESELVRFVTPSAGFSTGADKKMRTCAACPYTDFQYYYEYYGKSDYAHHWVESAFDKTRTQFKNGNADFSGSSFDGMAEFVKKGTAYMNVFMYVIREYEDALDDCESKCIDCNDSSVHAWGEGVVSIGRSLRCSCYMQRCSTLGICSLFGSSSPLPC